MGDRIVLKEESGGCTHRKIQIGENGVTVTSSKTQGQYISTLLKEMFLPQGYPSTVSDDYMAYQIWDTLQELCSSLNGTLASHAVFKGMGVGDAQATALSATFTWLLKDGVGMITNIMFAWSKGTQLDIDAKRWRLFADLLNDTAMLLELLSPLAPNYFTFTICCTTVFRSMVGVAGGCTRATIKQHQATSNNTADVSAKDGSQAMLSNLVGLVLSLTVINLVSSSPLLTWATFLALTFLHLFFNYKACSCLIMKSLNPARMSLLFKSWCSDHVILSPLECNALEPFIIGLRSKIEMGASLKDMTSLGDMTSLYEEVLFSKNYIIYTYKGGIKVCFESRADVGDILEGFYLACLRENVGEKYDKSGIFNPPTHEKEQMFSFFKKCEAAGWDLSFAPLGTFQLRYTLAS